MKLFNLHYKKLFVLLALAFLIANTAMAADDPLANHPGYVDFAALEFFPGQDAKVEVSLKAPLLSLLSSLISHEDVHAGAMVSQLERVMVKVYSTANRDVDQIATAMNITAEMLDQNDWDRIARVRDGGDHVDVYFRLSEDGSLIHGIAIMVVEPSETVFVNIVGDISAADISALSNHFQIHHLQDLDECQFNPAAC